MSVGYLANKYYKQRRTEEGSIAIDFLTSLTAVEKIDSLAGNWSLTGQERKSRDAALLRTGIRALGISGTPRAEEVLQKLLANESSLYDLESNHANLNDILETSIRENRAVRTLGLVGYYRLRSRLVSE